MSIDHEAVVRYAAAMLKEPALFPSDVFAFEEDGDRIAILSHGKVICASSGPHRFEHMAIDILQYGIAFMDESRRKVHSHE